MNKSENTPDSVFNKIYNEYSQLVMRITLSILRNKELAEDASQAAFLTMFQRENTEERSLGELFCLFDEEVAEITFD